MEARDLFRWESGATEPPQTAVLVHALRGAMDAGHAGQLVVAQLLRTHEHERLATFEVDELMDYRSRRPVITFETSRFTEYEEPELALDHLSTPEGGMLLLHGLEPDLRWNAFTRAVREIVEQLGVETAVGVHGIPMGVPHTRPLSITQHANRDELVDVGPDLFGTVQLPGSAAMLLEYRLGIWGHDAVGFAAHVPHYLAQSDYPAAAAELLRRLSRFTGITFDTTQLDDAAAELMVEVDKQVADSPEVQAVVRALEAQYDAFQEAAGRSLLASGDVPTGDELAAQFEAFLAEQDAGGRNPGAPGAAGSGNS